MRELANLSTSGGTALCLEDAGRLVVVAADGTRPVEESLPALLPALERSRSEFWDDIEERAHAAGLNGEDVRALVPEEDVLLLALRVSDYWATLALRWAAETDLTPELRRALESTRRERGHPATPSRRTSRVGRSATEGMTGL